MYRLGFALVSILTWVSVALLWRESWQLELESWKQPVEVAVSSGQDKLWLVQGEPTSHPKAAVKSSSPHKTPVGLLDDAKIGDGGDSKPSVWSTSPPQER